MPRTSAGLPTSVLHVFPLSCRAAPSKLVCVALRVTNDQIHRPVLQVAAIFNDVRAFRVYDGTSEVHRMSLGRSLKPRPKKTQ